MSTDADTAGPPDHSAGFSLDIGAGLREMRDWVHGFAAGTIRPAAAEWDEREETPWPILEEAAKVGLYSLDFFGQQWLEPSGLGIPIAFEELFWGDAGIALSLVGTTLAPQQSVTASVAYNPLTAGTNDTFVTITSNHGSVSVPLTGAAVTGSAVLTFTPATLDFGTVAVGHSVTRTVSLDNAGDIPLIISRAAAPAGAFSAAKPLPEGIILDPETIATQAITFTPTGPGPFTGQYKFNAENGQGWITVTLTGEGT